MSERKGRAMSRGVAQGARAYVGLLAVQLVVYAVSGVTVVPLVYVTQALVAMTALSLGVLAAWNLWSWLEESGEKREARRATELLDACPSPARYDLPMIIGTDESRKPVYYQVHGAGAAALRRAMENGTLSLNGLRYAGPPPVVHRTEVTYEMRDGVRLIKEMRVIEERMLPPVRKIARSECDMCEMPTEAVLRHPDETHLCRRCKVLYLQFP
jgi:hypothetical protein